MTEAGFPDSSAPRKRTRDEDDVSENGGKEIAGGPPEAKRSHSAGQVPHDPDLMALLERIDNMESNYIYLEQQQQEEEERLSGVMKSLEEEIGLKQRDPSSSSSSSSSDGAAFVEASGAGEDLQVSAMDGNNSMNIMTGEFNFFLDAADDDRYAMNHFHCMDNYAASYSQGWVPDDVGYAEVVEYFNGSLWEDDIWQLQDVNEIPQRL